MTQNGCVSFFLSFFLSFFSHALQASELKGPKPGDTLLGAIKLESTAPGEDFIQDKDNW